MLPSTVAPTRSARTGTHRRRSRWPSPSETPCWLRASRSLRSSTRHDPPADRLRSLGCLVGMRESCGGARAASAAARATQDQRSRPGGSHGSSPARGAARRGGTSHAAVHDAHRRGKPRTGSNQPRGRLLRGGPSGGGRPGRDHACRRGGVAHRSNLDSGLLRVRAGLCLPARRTRPVAGLPAAAAAPERARGCRRCSGLVVGNLSTNRPRRLATHRLNRRSGVGPQPDPACVAAAGLPGSVHPDGIVIFVEQTGPLALIEDLGRPGLAHLGVSPSGAADRTSSALANRLVGNPETAAVIEVTLGGLIIVARHFHWAAITGPLTQLWINQQPAASHAPFVLYPGDRLRVDPPAGGIRNYLAVRGGLQVPEVLGSRATDVLSGLGPEPLQSGVSIVVGHATGSLPGVDLAPPHPANRRLAVLPGQKVLAENAAYPGLAAHQASVES